MFRVFLTNFGHEIGNGFATLEAAKAFGISRGFEFRVMHGGNVVGGWGVFSGWRAF